MTEQSSNCPLITPVQTVETSYFLQMVPCVDPKTDRVMVLRDFTDNPRLPQIQSSPVLKQTSKKHYLKFPSRSRNGASKVKANMFHSLLRKTIKDPWMYTGLPWNEPYWSVGISYQQTWKRKGLHRGRLVASVPLGLHPSNRNVSVKTWETTRRRSESSDMMDEARTTEISGNERFSTAVQKQMLEETSSQYNPSATINNVSIPVKGAAGVEVGGNLGISATFGDLDRETVQRGLEFVNDATLKAIESIKTARKVVVEVESEIGLETTSAESLSNPNHVNTLTYLYYELVEDYEVEVKPTELNLYLFVPLPINHVITPEWLLAHECEIRPYIPCEKLASGFDAAREIVAQRKVEQQERQESVVALAPISKIRGAEDNDLKTVLSRLDEAVAAYRNLSGADTQDRFVGRWLYWEIVKGIAEKIVDAFENLETKMNGDNFDRNDRQSVVQAVLNLEQEIGNVDKEFGNVNLAVNALVGTTVLIAYGPFTPIIIGIAVTMEALGIDVAPDDAGLERKTERLINSVNTLLSSEKEEVEMALPSGIDPEDTQMLDTQKIAEQLHREQLRQEKAMAETSFEALQTYVRERNFFFHQVIWSSMGHSWVEERLKNMGLPSRLFDTRFEMFEGEYGAVRLTNLGLAKKLGFDPRSLKKWRTQLRESTEGLTKKFNTTVPAPGVLTEPLIGTCPGGDDFVAAHRELDVKRAAAEVRQLEAEASFAEKEAIRAAKRLEANMLDDPKPFDSASNKLVVNVDSIDGHNVSAHSSDVVSDDDQADN